MVIIIMVIMALMVEMMMMISEDCGRLCFSSQDATEFVSLHQKCHLLTFDPSFSIYYFAFCTFSSVLFTKGLHHHHMLGFFSVYKKLYFHCNGICKQYLSRAKIRRNLYSEVLGNWFRCHIPSSHSHNISFHPY